MLKRLNKLLFSLTILCLLSTTALWAQALFSTLTGIVTDPSGAVVSNAKVTLRNAESGSSRDTVTDSQGYYTFASVAVGTYDVTISAPGFESYKATGIALGGGEKRNVNASLQVGSTNQTIEVTGAADIVTPEDSGEKADVLTTDQLQNYVQTGSNAAEYMKILPGFSNYNGTNNKSNYSGQVIGINANGDGGSQSPLNNAFSYNGLPGNTLDIVSDGAHVSDPGCNCDTPVNPNSDFLSEFRVLASNFNAEEQKGPMVITTITKSGGSQFHGEGFFQARNYVLNANDAFANATGVKQPQDKFYYPGGEIGGPVLIPGTRFNHDHNKLFFFTGYEYFFQTIASGVLTATVPSAAERKGNFCNAPAEEGILYSGTTARIPNLSQFGTSGCQMPAAAINPSTQALMNLYPLPNTQGNGFNYASAVVFSQPNQQWDSRVDWNISDNTKVFVRYNLQRETQPFPVGLWWRNGDQVPYPTPIDGKNRSDSITGTITHVFSPTMTNEAVFAYTFIGFPNVFANPSAVNPSKVGFTAPLLTTNKATSSQIPSFGDFGPSEAALVFNPGGFEAGGATAGLYANKYMPSVSDTATKVIGTHTVKAGFFYEWIRNAQPANNYSNGYMQFNAQDTSISQFSTGNSYADMLAGIVDSFQQANFNRINDISYNTFEGFIQDDWKVNPHLTLDLGLRITHFQPWIDDEDYGYSAWIPSQYQGASCASAPTFCGFNWHSRDNSVPLGGFPDRTAFYQPRVGFAYDLNNGTTVLRGGWGRFYYHSGQFTSGLDTSAGSASVTVSPNSVGNKEILLGSCAVTNIANCVQLSSLGFNGQPSAPGAVVANDNEQPYTDSYSFTVDEKTPWKGLLEIGYVGNRSRDLQNTSGAGSDVNLVPFGAMLGLAQPANGNANNYRPYLGYGDINLATNNLYANFNAFQATWAHQGSRITMQLNYTYGKSLGICCGTTLGGGSATFDPFNLGNNYGAMPGDRRQIFNSAYSFDLGSPIKNNKFAAGVVNGWQLSGTTEWQSGANLSAGTNEAYNISFVPASNANGNVYIPGTSTIYSDQSLFGTNAIPIHPVITCNPMSGLSGHQYINPSCFAAPTGYANGGSTLPEIFGPSFFNSDLGLFKNFQIKESMKLQFRIQASNFLNHPLWSMSQGSALNLQYTQSFNNGVGGPFTLANPSFGTAEYKTGQRIVLLEAKFYF